MWRKWVKVNDLSSGQDSANKKIRFKISVMGSDLYYYSDADVVVKGRITVTGNKANRIKKKLTFKNNA